ncbi:DNA polymerase I [Ignatzschineria cameli]|uniref:DNA polymerase I n=1 Tax=Ignatzschineria cameli TaxID=2182793 RepID=A0A2U2ARC8_9GAMM|nr:DNA polymerase I [Ignatzschineria cameli]PWD86826.1 DNA polymerase I [Ignatzschineria cameli]PWD91800.1 DNA polymerase I [Ignatzschineria cameli]PWD93614.1 DNA polymerase I [Ignatzschineria cameli]PWD94356.1 DNA polymerase I [Ignatzschineria cameli]
MSKTFLVVDGSNFLFRAFHALPPLKSPDGRPTGAIRGVISMFEKLVREFKPDYLGVVFDASGKSFRNDLFEDYKAHRPPMPEDLRAQIEPLYEIIDLMGFPRISIPGIEADDVIATLAVEAKAKGLRTIIASSDKDLAQLVEDGVITMYDGMKNEMLGRAEIYEKYGVYPEQVRDYLALMGDSADNIPGIQGVGPKTAAKWIHEWGDLDAIVENAEKIKGKVGERLRENLDLLDLSKTLTTLLLEAPLPVKVEDLTPNPPFIERLREVYQDFGFRQLLLELDKADGGESFVPPVAQSVASDQVELAAHWINPSLPAKRLYQTITDLNDLERYLTLIPSASLLALDTETDGLEFMRSNLVGISLSVAPGDAIYIPFKQAGLENPLAIDAVMARLKPILEDEKIPKVGQNIKFDWHILRRQGVELRGIVDDTMLASYIYDPTGNRHNMDALAELYLGFKTTPFEEIAGKGRSQKRFDEIDIETASFYACEDADITLQLQRSILPRLRSEATQYKVYQEMEVPLISVLAKMEHEGILVDAAHLEQLSAEFGENLSELETKAYELAGEEFNMSSSKQVGEILFEKLGLPVIKKTPKGAPSTAEDVLQKLAEDYPLPKIIIEYREFSKLRSTYTDSLVAEINSETGRVHTSFNQAQTSTGRLSSSNPNLQNIPIRTKEGRRIREAFIAKEGSLLLAADYSQIELRLMAHFSQDETMLRAFNEGKDIHAATAAEVFGIPLEKVTGEERRAAKAINFGLIYGMGAFGLAKQLGISRTQAQEYISLYFSRYTGVLNYMEEAKEKAKKHGYVETALGRRLYLPGIHSSNAIARSGAERVAINAPLQGTAADIIKLAMLKVDRSLAENSHLTAKMLLQVHDELILEAPIAQMEEVRALLVDAMTDVLKLDVPLIVEVGSGKNWDETAS